MKNIFQEWWDDYQLRSVAYGGNKKIFQVLIENKLEKAPIVMNYNH